ncbi:uncharacterized protein V6R79_011129 [Siganus canaliculatus]
MAELFVHEWTEQFSSFIISFRQEAKDQIYESHFHLIEYFGLVLKHNRRRLSAARGSSQLVHEEHLDKTGALAGCYLSCDESNVRSAARLRRGSERDKIHCGPPERSQW